MLQSAHGGAKTQIDEPRSGGVFAEKWLGGRDSNPDTQIQSPNKYLSFQQDQALSGADLEQLRQNPQHGRNDDWCPSEEDTLP
jgi:hypothetical protein